MVGDRSVDGGVRQFLSRISVCFRFMTMYITLKAAERYGRFERYLVRVLRPICMSIEPLISVSPPSTIAMTVSCIALLYASFPC